MNENAVKPKAQNKEKITLICMFAVFAMLTFIGAFNHEIWFDEAQAWNIARYNDIPGVIAQMRYEGHPPLWHFVLYIFSHAGCPADVLPFISWFITCITAGLVLWKAPFKPLMKGIIMFSGGFLFYNSVTSRVYCLIMLLLVLIAINYKSRNEHPIRFGILVALLADTHVMMCGLVGILGIYMIIDLFKLWKSSSTKSNIMRLLGLAIAGAGVIFLVLPLIGSISANSMVSDTVSNLSFASVLYKIYYAFSDIFIGATMDNGTYLPHALVIILGGLGGLLFLVALILLRHYRKAFTIQLVFSVFYVVVCNVIWWVLPSRASIFVFSFAIIYWIAIENEKPVYREPKALNINSKPLKGLVDFIRKADKNFDKSYCAVLLALTVATIPNAVYQLFGDYFNEYSYSKSTAEFVKNYLPEDSVFVIKSRYYAASQYIAYLPEYKFYMLDGNVFSTFTSQVYEDLKDYEHIYLLDFPDEYEIDYSLPLYSNLRDIDPYGLSPVSYFDTHVAIYEYNLETEVVPYL